MSHQTKQVRSVCFLVPLVLRRTARDDAVSADVTATTTLAEYLREHQRLPGTKTMCREGMCGACVVNVSSVNPATGRRESRAVNSCMVPLRACQDWNVEVLTSRTCM